MRFSLLALAFCLASGWAHAQPLDWRADPVFDTVNLRAGFQPDPIVRTVAAGGSTRNPISGAGCAGYLNASAPDLDLNYQAGSLPLTITADSNRDISLVVFTPGGRWICDDDGGDGLNPLVRFSSPESGNYNIWVATYDRTSDRPRACVAFSELGESCEVGSGHRTNRPSAPATTLSWWESPLFGTLYLDAGFAPDPAERTVRAGGDTRTPISESGCTGYLTASAPDLNVDYSSGTYPLTIRASSSDDVSLVVRTPSGRWLCDDDSGDGLNPRIRMTRPDSGVYNIWVATYAEMDRRPSTRVSVSER